VLAPKGAGSFGQDQDDLVLMPIRLVQRRLNGDDDVNLDPGHRWPGVGSPRASARSRPDARTPPYRPGGEKTTTFPSPT
jgi:hypothetical protein